MDMPADVINEAYQAIENTKDETPETIRAFNAATQHADTLAETGSDQWTAETVMMYNYILNNWNQYKGVI